MPGPIFTAKQQEWDAKARRWWYDFYSLVHVASFRPGTVPQNAISTFGVCGWLSARICFRPTSVNASAMFGPMSQTNERR